MYNENSEFCETLKSLGLNTIWFELRVAFSENKYNFKKLIEFSDTGTAYLNDLVY
jgi:hypothetical protein